MPRKAKDLTGQRFGRLVALAPAGRDPKGYLCWQFACDCGNKKILPSRRVLWDGVQSCGCLHNERMAAMRSQNIAGCRYHRLVALEPTEKRDAGGSVVWRCRCDCGGEAFYSVNALHSGRIHSCGCLYREVRRECGENRRDLVDDTLLSTLVAAKTPRQNNNSGATGVSRDKRSGKWHAYINFRKKRYFLGLFVNFEDALKARRNAEELLHDSALKENLSLLTPDALQKLKERLSPSDFSRLLSETPKDC